MTGSIKVNVSSSKSNVSMTSDFTRTCRVLSRAPRTTLSEMDHNCNTAPNASPPLPLLIAVPPSANTGPVNLPASAIAANKVNDC